MALQKVLNLYKRVGETPLEVIENFKADHRQYKDIPMTYAGRLDPAAEGVLLVLAGEECKIKDKYLGLDKAYRGEILFGASSDTGDLLGKKESMRPFQVSDPAGLKDFFANLKENAKRMEGERKQSYPSYSSKTVEGKPLWKWAREGADVEIPSKAITVYSFDIIKTRVADPSEVLDRIMFVASATRGDFRQQEILSSWAGALKDRGDTFVVASFEAKVSSGTYLRELARELGVKLNRPSLLYSLSRTKVGSFSVEDSRS